MATANQDSRWEFYKKVPITCWLVILCSIRYRFFLAVIMSYIDWV